MQGSAAIKLKIMDEEQLSLHPYLDPPKNLKGVYSIGYGHQILPSERYLMAGIDKAKAIQLFNADIAWREKDITARLTRPVTQAQFDAILDFHYNVGNVPAGKIVTTWNTTGSVADTVARMKLYNISGGKVNPDLVTRRNYEAGLFGQLGEVIQAVTSEVKKN